MCFYYVFDLQIIGLFDNMLYSAFSSIFCYLFSRKKQGFVC